ncbi:Nif3-like dinuclear metal center hexameric protein [Shimazuella sp. AN120528]|uniref:Nif3-like dinuclear metal center hexameric protein n=1 Tax=Shimazuella soli TaxID=1892854 RepID=UPI001F0E550E|nr:Nif3-like dinuclear metal center hexameric protein [Shimazuella soli]MCH5583895.1 Nif3-like dinuclear metal center hexameric protein [Shimazuella soli]
MAINGQQLIEVFERMVPPDLALDQDRIGFQLGSLERKVTGILVTLEITDAVVNEAIALGANWIFTHHALIFQPLDSVRMDQPKGKLIEKLITNQIQVYVAHTNLDTVKDGVNDVLADEIGLLEKKTFLVHGSDPLLKLVVFVPSSHLEAVRTAIGNNGAGAIGAYSHCTFAGKGTGTFLAGKDTTPFVGIQGELSKVDEYRLETIMPKSLEKRVLQAVFDAHPYEEVAYDIYPLARSVPYGMGKVGNLLGEMTLEDFVLHLKKAYQLDHVHVVGNGNEKVKRIALLGGAGSRYVLEAKRHGADVYLTGDIDYHTAKLALEENISLVDIGHATEQRVVPHVCRQLENLLEGNTKVFPSKVNQNPFRVL